MNKGKKYTILTIFIIISIYTFIFFTYIRGWEIYPIVYVLLPLIRGIIIYDIISIIKQDAKRMNYIKYIVSISAELLCILSEWRYDSTIYIALLALGIRIFMELIGKKKTTQKTKKWSISNINITIIIIMLFFIIAIIIENYLLFNALILLLLEFIVLYDIKRTVKDPNTVVNYLNIIIFNILALLISIPVLSIYYDFLVYYVVISLLLLRIIVTLICIMFKKIPVIKRNKRKIMISAIISCVSCLIIVLVVKSLIIVRVPYQICGLIPGREIKFLETDKLKVINNINDLENLFKVYNDENKYYNAENIHYSEGKEKIIKEFGINKDFFDKYYLIFINEVTGNSATPKGIDYIIYNKSKNQLKFIQETTIQQRISAGADVMSYSSYFVKIEKKYAGEVSWKTKYKPF